MEATTIKPVNDEFTHTKFCQFAKLNMTSLDSAKNSSSNPTNKRFLFLLLLIFSFVFSAFVSFSSQATKINSIVIDKSNIKINYQGGKVSASSFVLDSKKTGYKRLVIDIKNGELAGSVSGGSNLSPSVIRVAQFSKSPLITRFVIEGPKEQISNIKYNGDIGSFLLASHKGNTGIKTEQKIDPKLEAQKNAKKEAEKKLEEQKKQAQIKQDQKKLEQKKLEALEKDKLEKEKLEKEKKGKLEAQKLADQKKDLNQESLKQELKEIEKAIDLKEKEIKGKEDFDSSSPIIIKGNYPTEIQIKLAKIPKGKIKYKIFRLHSPERLALDLYDCEYEPSQLIPNQNPSPLVIAVRSGRPFEKSKIIRLVIDLSQKSVEYKDTVNEVKGLLLLSLTQSVNKALEDNLQELEKSARSDLKVVIDAGHGGYDSGATYSGVEEKNLTLSISKKVEALLSNLQITVVQTRKDDQFVSLEDRVNITRAAKPDLFVSIHCNAMESNSGIAGIETYYFTPQSRALGSVLHKKIVAFTKAPDRRVRKARFVVIRETAIPSVLMEVGFVSNPSERAKLLNKDYQDTIAKSITEGVVEHLKSMKSSHAATISPD